MNAWLRRIAGWLTDKNASADAARLDREEQSQKERLRERLAQVREQLDSIDRRRIPRGEAR